MRFLATMVGIYIQTDRLMRGIYELRVEMGSVAVTYIPSFIKIGLSIQKLIEEHTDTQTGWK
jgi:hypothetical protein